MLQMAAPKRDKLLLEVLRPNPTRGEGAPADWEGNDPRDGLMSPTLTPIGEAPERSSALALPPSAIYIAIAAVLGMIVLTWAIAYRLGEAEGRQSILGGTAAGGRNSGVVDPTLPPTDSGGWSPGPGAAPPGGGSGAGGTGSAAVTGGSGSSIVAGGVGTPAGGVAPSPLVLTASGSTSTDPRVVGMNYLQVATLARDQAETAVRFLSDRGVQAVAVSDGKGRFRVFSLALAVPSADFARMTSARRDHERLLAELGAVFARDFRGGSDFSQPLWRRYDG
jgi:hypothetical protein